MRTAPCFEEDMINENYDTIICESLIDILNIRLLESAWSQATLLIAKGGLGLRPFLEVALAGFLSNFSASEKLIRELQPQSSLPISLQLDKLYEFAVVKWKDHSKLTRLPLNRIF